MTQNDKQNWLNQAGQNDIQPDPARADRWMNAVRAKQGEAGSTKRKRLPRAWFRRPRTPLDRVISTVVVLCLLTGTGLLLKIPVEYYLRSRVTGAIIDSLDTGEPVIVDANALPFSGEDETALAIQTPPTLPDTTRTSVTRPPDWSGPNTPTPSPAPVATVALEALGRLDIPKIDNDSPILEGATEVTLRYGIGRYSPSAPIGEEGRTVLLGHRTRYYYGIYFNRIFELEIGDPIGIKTPDAEYVYRIYATEVIYKDALMNKFFEPAEGSQIMLVTCDFRTDPNGDDRYLVHAMLESTTPKN